MAGKQRYLALRGTFVDCPLLGEVRVRQDAICVVDLGEGADGSIVSIAEGAEEERVLAEYGLDHGSLVRLQAHQFLLPGFCDIHIHAPQYPYTGTATDTPLMQWLDKYTFPTEAKYQDLQFAGHVYRQVVRRLLDNGTTAAAYYATLHLEPSQLLADIAEELGQRAVIGKVSMDRNSPVAYQEGAQAGIESCEAFAQYVLGKGLSRLAPAVTPRFVPTCSRRLLRGCGEVARRHGGGLHIQSHVSESYDAVAFMEELHPEVNGRDLTLFDAAGLLTPKSILAHGVLLSDMELRRMAEAGAAIAHCPLSNFYYADKILRVRHALRMGVHVGLGTDVAGGYSPSMLTAIRSAVLASRALHMQNIQRSGDPGAQALKYQAEGDSDVLSWRDGLWLATMGGAEALGWEDRIGSFERGKQFDALLVDTGVAAAFDTYPSDSLLERLEKFVNLGDDRNVAGVWVQGRRVKG